MQLLNFDANLSYNTSKMISKSSPGKLKPFIPLCGIVLHSLVKIKPICEMLDNLVHTNCHKLHRNYIGKYLKIEFSVECCEIFTLTGHCGDRTSGMKIKQGYTFCCLPISTIILDFVGMKFHLYFILFVVSEFCTKLKNRFLDNCY